MAKLDLKKLEHDLYSAPKDRAVVVDVPKEAFLMVDGSGGPNDGSAFQDAISGLYAVAYSLKFAMKKRSPARDYAVMPIEALWWWEGDTPFHEAPRKEWRWTLMVRLPDFVEVEDVGSAIEDARLLHPQAAKVRFEHLHEGRCMQTLHVGPYQREWPTIQRLHDAIREAGYVMDGKHHEIYLGDPRRSKPENLRTIIRQPVRWTDEGSA